MGDGAQWFSWIHREDAVGIVVEALTNESMRGPVNVTAPNPVRMGEMCAALGRTPGEAGRGCRCRTLPSPRSSARGPPSCCRDRR